MHAKSVVKVVKVVLLGAVAAGCGSARPPAPPPARMALTSPAFAAGAAIPRAFTCDGADRPPPLRVAATPAGARSLALIVVDPDAPGGTFVHWAAFDVAPTTRALGPLPPGARQARNSFGRTGYGPPCPPRSDPPHRYVFTVYALSRTLSLPNGAPAAQVEAQVARGALASGQLVGHYGR